MPESIVVDNTQTINSLRHREEVELDLALNAGNNVYVYFFTIPSAFNSVSHLTLCQASPGFYESALQIF